MSEMIDRIAARMMQADGIGPEKAAWLAREALEAIREPTGSMVDALERCEHYCDSCKGTSFSGWNGYRAMIDEALK